MKLPVLSRFNFGAKSATLVDRLNILNWLGFGARSATVTVEDDGDTSATITVQVVDANGNDVSEVTAIDVLIGGTEWTAEDIGTLNDVSTGTLAATLIADAAVKVLTDANGVAVFDFAPTAADDVFVTAIVKDRAVSGSASIA